MYMVKYDVVRAVQKKKKKYVAFQHMHCSLLKVHDLFTGRNSRYFTAKFYTRIHYLLICTKISISTELDLQNDLL